MRQDHRWSAGFTTFDDPQPHTIAINEPLLQ
jgi:hypothetical protein